MIANTTDLAVLHDQIVQARKSDSPDVATLEETWVKTAIARYSRNDFVKLNDLHIKLVVLATSKVERPEQTAHHQAEFLRLLGR